MECAAKAVGTWDGNPATPGANAFRFAETLGVCDFGTVPRDILLNEEHGEEDPINDEEGIYVIEECMGTTLKATEIAS